MIVAMPVKTLPVLFVTLLFMCFGGMIGALFVEGFTTVNIATNIVLGVGTVMLHRYILLKNKKGSPLFGLSYGLWITVTIIGVGVGLIMVFAT
jgi:energy-converting hydrogenase Eha subunit C